MRFVARVLSLIFLVFAVLAGIVDAIQSVAAGRPVLTPLIKTLTVNSPDTLVLLQGLFDQYLPAWAWEFMAGWILTQPACAVFLSGSLIFYMAGYRRPRPAGRFAA